VRESRSNSLTGFRKLWLDNFRNFGETNKRKQQAQNKRKRIRKGEGVPVRESRRNSLTGFRKLWLNNFQNFGETNKRKQQTQNKRKRIRKGEGVPVREPRSNSLKGFRKSLWTICRMVRWDKNIDKIIKRNSNCNPAKRGVPWGSRIKLPHEISGNISLTNMFSGRFGETNSGVKGVKICEGKIYFVLLSNSQQNHQIEPIFTKRKPNISKDSESAQICLRNNIDRIFY